MIPTWCGAVLFILGALVGVCIATAHFHRAEGEAFERGLREGVKKR